MPPIIETFADISDHYDAAFVDLWGCLHDGVSARPAAVDAMRDYRTRGGKVVLVTNSPRPRDSVAAQIKDFGVTDDAWDAIATSGDSARSAMFQGAVGEKVWFMGESPRDDDFFTPLNIIENPVDIQQVPLSEAEGIVCCGPFDPQADPAVNRPEFLFAKQRGLKLLCANPDIVVDRGEVREWCAGALAALGTAPAEPRIICIGDGIGTDILGAQQEDLDSLFITGGLAREETGTGRAPQPEALQRFLDAAQVNATYAIGYLR